MKTERKLVVRVNVKSALLLILFASLCVSGRCGNEKSGSGGSGDFLAQSLKWLNVGEQPRILHERNASPEQKTSPLRLRRSSGSGGIGPPPAGQPVIHPPVQRFATLPSCVNTGPYSKFVVKHLYNSGIFPVGAIQQIDSFKEFTSNPAHLRKYLVDLNLKLLHDSILPGPKHWVNRITKITIIDTDLRSLNTDIMALPNYLLTPPNQNLYTTTNAYRVTHLELHSYIDARQNKIVDVVANQYQSTVTVGVERNPRSVNYGQLKHLHTITATIPLNPQPAHVVTTFTQDELKKNARFKNAFWHNLGVPIKARFGVLDETSPTYHAARAAYRKQFESVIKTAAHTPPPGSSSSSSGSGGGAVCTTVPTAASGRRKRAASLKSGGENCAVFVNPKSGKVDHIDPEKFVAEYEKANEQEKQRMADLAAGAEPDRIYVAGDSSTGKVSTKKMRDIIMLEQTKTHVANAHAIHEMVNVNKRHSIESSEKIFEQLKDAKVKVSPSKLSRSLANSKATKSFVSGVNKVGTPLGYFFMGKTIINGIMHNETTSLAIVGGRLGFDVVSEGTAKIGKKFFDAASKTGKATKFIGKAAGPIGGVADIGLGVWSLTKSIGKLLNATNKYERNAAIADVVQNSVDIALSAVVIGVSLAFPPLAPLAMAVGLIINVVTQIITAIFQAANEVERINAEIPLLGFEKAEVFQSRFWDWFGTRQKDYIDYLLEEKAANDMAVTQNLKFLEENENIRGVVFPARTLHYDGGCRLTTSYCKFNLFGCWGWSGDTVHATGCDWSRPCPCTACTTWSDGIDRQRCLCDGEKTTEFGFARLDQTVDFREMRWMFWDRAVPKDIEGGTFKCKPGSTYDMGYRTSQNHSTWDYQCENAIGLLQPNWRTKEGQFMLFDLQEGNDRVYLDEDDFTPNVFRMGDGGNKTFYGGGGRNEFVFDGSCTKTLNAKIHGGKSDNDAISVYDNCAKGTLVSMDFSKGKLTLGWRIATTFEGVEGFTGRKGEAEEVVVTCSTRNVAVRGGNERQPDKVLIGKDDACKYNLTVMISEYSNVVSEARNGELTFLIDNLINTITVDMDFYRNSAPKVNILFIATASEDVIPLPLPPHDSSVSAFSFRTIYVPNGNATFNFIHKNDNDNDSVAFQCPPIYFSEWPTGSPHSVLMVSNKSTFYHSLSGNFPSSEKLVRRGSPILPNMFEVINDGWLVTGGKESDHFILHSPAQEIHGEGGEDTVKLHQNLLKPVLLDFTGVKFTGIENVVGSPGKDLSVICSCELKMTAALGGSTSSPNKVTIPAKQQCSKRQLNVVAKGATRVEIMGAVQDFEKDGVNVVAIGANFSIEASASITKEDLLRFQLETGSSNTSGLFVTIQTSHKNWSIASFSADPKQKIIQSKISGDQGNHSESVQLKFNLGKTLGEKYAETAFIQLVPMNDLHPTGGTEPSAQLLFEESSGRPTAYFRLRENSTKVHGYVGLPNTFQILNDSWTIVGGLKNDLFYLKTAASKKTSIDGGGGSEDTLILQEDENDTVPRGTFLVDLNKGHLGFLQTSDGGTVKEIHSVIGRPKKPDIIHASCSTKLVDGGGGKSVNNQWDTIYISGQGCSQGEQEMTVKAADFTNVRNAARFGKFKYVVENLTSSNIQINTARENEHAFHFLFHPWEQIDKVAFDSQTETIRFRLKTPEENRAEYGYKMTRWDNSMDYTNPTFVFQRPQSDIVTSVSVDTNQIVSAIYLISSGGLNWSEEVLALAVDVNQFLINVTKSGSKPGPGGGGSISGSSEAAMNQFWLFNLENSLESLDGGSCALCTNSLHLDSKLKQGHPLEIDLINERGFLKSESETLIGSLQNIHELYGRTWKWNGSEDRVAVTCAVKKVLDVEKIRIHYEKGDENCAFDMLMNIGESSRVWFQEDGGFNRKSHDSSADVFNYFFTSTRTFDPDGDEDSFSWLNGTTHNYFFSFLIDDVSYMRFDDDEEKFVYALKNSTEEFSHSMLSGLQPFDQFYTQPVMVTSDKFQIQVSRVGGLQLTLGAGGGFPSQEVIEAQVIPGFESTSKRLGVSILVQTDTDFFFAGHDGKNLMNPSDEENIFRNVLQNVGYSRSHLLGANMANTIYEIVALDESVFIYPGFDNDNVDNADGDSKQTIDLTDVVMEIRMSSGTKFVPGVMEIGKDLVISMYPYDKNYPGVVTIVDGSRAGIASRLQILLYQTIMDLQKMIANDVHRRMKRSADVEWKIRPRPINVPPGYVYSIAAEDLEDDQEIQLSPGESQVIDAAFTAARNESDLILSDILEKTRNNSNGYNITTVMINDFYLIRQWKPPGENGLIDDASLPSQIRGVKLTLPGLQAVLHSGQITENYQPDPEKPVECGRDVRVTDWKSVLHETENELLKNLPGNPTRLYHRYEYKCCSSCCGCYC